MTDQLPWQRYWVSAKAEDRRKSAHPQARRTTAELSRARCVVMLGLPGMGKTTEMMLLARLTEQTGAYSDFVSLGLVSSRADLERRLQESSGRVVWAQGNEWVIHLDGLDEAVIEQADLISAVDGSIRLILTDLTSASAGEKLDRLNRLKVRISCRAAEWPESLSTSLQSTFGDVVEVVQLEELDPEDAEHAATQAGIPPQVWHDILQRLEGAEALARRPITLRLLLSSYEQSGEVPTRQVPLYHRGVLALLEEANELRRRNGLVGRLDTRSRLLVAARIAAATTFSNSTSISISALFVPLSDTKFTWTHRTFSEFLAAYYLAERGLSTEQLIEFLGSSQDPKQRIPPQLHEVAAWVASMRQDFFRALVSRQPTILLSSDVAAASDHDRAHLVRQLLEDFDLERLFDADWDLRRRYSKLAHPGLRGDLLPYLTTKNHSLSARRAAIQIATECGERSLADELASLALDRSDDIHLRVQAVIAVGQLGTAEVKSALKPLALPGDSADKDDELRGWSLAALWPSLISFEELLDALTPRKRSNLIGGYWRFQRYIELDLSPEESTRAVKWVREQMTQAPDDDRISSELLVAMLSAAWRNADDGRVVEAFAEFSHAAESYQTAPLVYSSEFAKFTEDFNSGNAQYRHRLAEAVFARQDDEGKAARLSIFGHWPLLIPSDIPWLLEQLRESASKIPAETLVEAIVALVQVGGIDGRDDVWEAAEHNERLAAGLAAQFTTSLDGSLARYSRRKAQRSDEDSFDLEAEAAKRLARAQEHVDEWWEFNLLFFINGRGRLGSDEFTTDLTAQDLWRQLTSDQQQATIDWAYAYLSQDKVPQRDWLGTSTFHRPAAAAYRAFRLLFSEAPARFESLEPSIWGRWVHAILGTAANEDALGSRIRAELVARAYHLAPRAFMAALARLLIREAAEKSVRQTVDRLELTYDERIAHLLRGIALREKTPAAPRLELLRFLVSRNDPDIRRAVVAAMFVYDTAPLLSLDEGDFIKLVGEFLFRFTDEAWPHLVELDKHDGQRARAIFLEAHSLHGIGSFPITGFSEAQLRDLYLWIEENFPASPEDGDGGARWIGPADQVQATHRAVLGRLVQLGTPAAVQAVRDLTISLPEQTWLKWQLAEAEAAFQLLAWRSRLPGDVLRTIASYGVLPPVRSAKEELRVAAFEALAESSPTQAPKDLIAPAVDVSPAPKQPARSLNILSVATEWSSAHGGLSTLNRDLCAALAEDGHTVTCLVLDATDEDVADAKSHGVGLLTCPADPGVEGSQRLFLASRGALGTTGAKFVIGHDHITGPAAFNIARRVLQVHYVHIVHTIPDEIEAHKSKNLYQSVTKGADKAETQLKQCKQADLVVGVGPRIYQEIADKLGASPPAVQLRPGLAPSLMAQTNGAKKPSKVNVLFQGRLEHALLKGAKLAFQATALVRKEATVDKWQRPDLVMRGFDKDKFEEQCIGVIDEDGLKTFVKPRFYTTDEVALSADLSSASLLLMPSKREGFGLIALEAISAGIPVLMSTDSGIAEMLHKDPEVVAAIDADSAQAAVCDVDGATEAIIAAEWAKQMTPILADREAAFARADKLRKDLASVLTWRAAARALVDELERL
jgi:glycosyltransferase involved in cell wall biosynthesis